MMRSLMLAVLLAAAALRAHGQVVTARARTLLTWHHHTAPVPLLIDLASDRVATGTLRVRILQRARALAELVQPDVAVGTASQTIAVLVPPPSGCVPTAAGGDLMTQVAVEFAPDGGAFAPAGEIPILFHGVGFAADGDEDSLRVPGLSVLALRSKVGAEGATAKLAGSMFGRTKPPGSTEVDAPRFRPRIGAIYDAEFPAESLAYCAADLVVLAGECVDQLRPAQLSAIARWVRAGGRLACVLDGELPGPSFTQAIGGLVAPQEPSFALRSWLGRRLAERLVQCELGTVAVCATADELADPSVRHALFPVASGIVGSRGPLAMDDAGSGAAAEFVRALAEGLPQQKFEVIPVGWLAIAFVLLLVVVGPLDGWLLRPRSRRATWFALPIAVALATWVIIDLPARRYAGIAQRQRLIVEDVAADGAALRRWEITLAFPGESGDITLEGEGTRVRVGSTALDSVGEAENVDANTKPWGRLSRPEASLRYALGSSERGPAAGSQRTTFGVTRWTPLLLMRFSLETAAEPGIDWPILTTRLRSLSKSGPQRPLNVRPPELPRATLALLITPNVVSHGSGRISSRGPYYKPRANLQSYVSVGGTDRLEWVLEHLAPAGVDAHHCPRGGGIPVFSNANIGQSQGLGPAIATPDNYATLVVAWRDALGVVVQRHTFPYGGSR